MVVGAVVLAVSAAPFAELAARLVQQGLQSTDTSGDIVARAIQSSGHAEFVLMLATLALLPAVVEEVLFRGVVFAAFARQSLSQAWLGSSLLFAAFHLEPTQVAGTFCVGLAFGLARLRSGSLVTSTVAHASYNAFILCTLRFGTVAGEPGPAASAVSLAVGGVGAALGTWLLFRTPYASRSRGG